MGNDQLIELSFFFCAPLYTPFSPPKYPGPVIGDVEAFTL